MYINMWAYVRFVLLIHTVNREYSWTGCATTSRCYRSKLLRCKGGNTKLAVRCHRSSAEWRIGRSRLEWCCSSIGRSNWWLKTIKKTHIQNIWQQCKNHRGAYVIKIIWLIFSSHTKSQNIVKIMINNYWLLGCYCDFGVLSKNTLAVVDSFGGTENRTADPCVRRRLHYSLSDDVPCALLLLPWLQMLLCNFTLSILLFINL